jgi:methylated-DNA-protein-cysteine methyltransferase related protein
MASDRNQRVWQVVARIPEGKVATYGQVAALAGLPGRSAARQVGYALSALSEDTQVPWHRVVNAKGQVSLRADPERPDYQRWLLEAEGVAFGLGGVLDLARYRWNGET